MRDDDTGQAADETVKECAGKETGDDRRGRFKRRGKGRSNPATEEAIRLMMEFQRPF